MRGLILCLCVCVIVAAAACGSYADSTYRFEPLNYKNLWNLDHNSFYSWGVKWDVPSGEIISSATLYIKNINDWKDEPNDVLYIRLLDNPPVGEKKYWDGQKRIDQWNWTSTSAPVYPLYGAERPLVGFYTDEDGSYGNPKSAPYPQGTDLAFAFDADLLGYLNRFAADGVFGFGFDPDCHYYNSGISLEITTSPTRPGQIIPEPFSIMLGSLGLGVVALIRKRR